MYRHVLIDEGIYGIMYSSIFILDSGRHGDTVAFCGELNEKYSHFIYDTESSIHACVWIILNMQTSQLWSGNRNLVVTYDI